MILPQQEIIRVWEATTIVVGQGVACDCFEDTFPNSLTQPSTECKMLSAQDDTQPNPNSETSVQSESSTDQDNSKKLPVKLNEELDLGEPDKAEAPRQLVMKLGQHDVLVSHESQIRCEMRRPVVANDIELSQHRSAVGRQRTLTQATSPFASWSRRKRAIT